MQKHHVAIAIAAGLALFEMCRPREARANLPFLGRLPDSPINGPDGPGILEKIKKVTGKPVTTIINTHTHGDHTGSNIEFPTVTEIVAHENTKTNMAKMDAFKGANARFLPNKTVGDKLSLFDGLDRIDLYYFGRGHTDGDVVVVFPGKGVAHFGDLFPAKMAPIIDTTNGGSGSAYPETLAKAAAAVTGIDRVVTGHFAARAPMRAGVPGSVIYTFFDTLRWSDVREYADFVREFVSEAS